MTEKCDWDDLVERDGLFYKKFTDVPFTGEEQKEFENGEKDDPQVSYCAFR